jgi:hypothetical protein
VLRDTRFLPHPSVGGSRRYDIPFRQMIIGQETLEGEGREGAYRQRPPWRRPAIEKITISTEEEECRSRWRDVEAAVVVAGNVGKEENGMVVAVVAFHTTTSHSRQEAQEGAIRGRGDGTRRGGGASGWEASA